MNILTRKILSLLFVSGLYLNTFAQQQTLIGLNVNGEIFPNGFKPAAGLTFEKQLFTHSGFETGIFYRTEKTSVITTYIYAAGYQSYAYTFSLRYLAVPVLYKYYSRIINFSAGPVADFYIGWKQKNDGSPVRIENVEVGHKVNIGFLVKAGKLIALNKKFLLEPELRFGSDRTLENVSLGIGVAGKYRF
ncbi:MAG: hypothetical protein EOP41_05355 [Sphingobacteriaceae bacterium]|nr:MAG: hypothetical protein EOP41_05355 [Sphingobacteriaceae bacterium]